MPDDELARLQARAYGPSPDLDRDPVALARLRELEDAQRDAHRADDRVSPEPVIDARADATPVDRAAEDAVLTRLGFAADTAGARWRSEGDPHPDDDRERPGDPAVAASVPDGREATASAHGADAPARPTGSDPAAPADPPAPEPRAAVLGRRTRIAWAVSLVAAVVVGAGVTAWTFPWGVRDDAHHAARLTAQAGEPPEAIVTQFRFGAEDAATVQSYGEYLGVGIYASEDCIQAAFGEGTRSFTGGCAGGGIAPIMDLYVPASDRTEMYGDVKLPDELLQRFPDGGMLRFTLDGDVVLVDEGEIPWAYR
ncbi:hypothetical protein AB0N73_14385 [Microbacterium sp. NPDC089189]|uniref:hypothetical protein n=1 Tax=Microbacterium sp. NPDC089189 TaxID=3154972 RepID=UPI00341B02FF